MAALGIGLIAAGVTTGVVALVVLHVLPTGMSPLRNPVSQYGITRYRTGYRVQTIAFAVAGLGAAIGISSLPGAAAGAGVFGLIERAFYGAMTAWLVVVAVLLARPA